MNIGFEPSRTSGREVNIGSYFFLRGYAELRSFFRIGAARRSWMLAIMLIVGLVNASQAQVPQGEGNRLGPFLPRSQKLPMLDPDNAGISSEQLRYIESVVRSWIADQRLPGCVVTVGRRAGIVYQRAFGQRQYAPNPAPMTVDTMFDLASLTKPVATATSIMILAERGLIRLRDKVSQYIPEFSGGEKSNVTILHLLTHQSGLIADNAERDYYDGYKLAFERIHALELKAKPGERFIYSDVGFLLLGEIVERVSSRRLSDFARANIFFPAEMNETMFRPSDYFASRCAPTEQRNGRWIQGEVHDPRSYHLGGVAGHAGLFSTADDLARYATMMLSGGTLDRSRVLGRQTIEMMIQRHAVPGGMRALGWDVQSGYSLNKAENFSPRAFGHSGFTGTAMWIDPELDLYVIFLSNRVHPDGKGLVNPLAGRVATIAASAVLDRSANLPGPVELPLAAAPNVPGGIPPVVVPGPPANPGPPTNSTPPLPPGPPPHTHVQLETHPVLTGLDRLEQTNLAPLRGKRVGVITNHTAVNRNGRHLIDILKANRDIRMVAFFSPEHGFMGRLDQSNIPDQRDPDTGLPIYSLYGATRKPTPEMLRGIDLLLFDIQDVGARYYTYISTMALAMEAARENNISFMVLDRPNPITGEIVDGPVGASEKSPFIAFHPIAVRHGMTVGELANMFQAERYPGVKLEVIRMLGWRRADWFDQTALMWINPSPNMRNLNQAILYPGIGLLETTNISVGRGTDTPFEIIGAPWIEPVIFAQELNRKQMPGVRFVPTVFTPNASVHKDKRCGGVQIIINDRFALDVTRIGFEIASSLRRLYPTDWNVDGYERLLVSNEVMSRLRRNEPAREWYETFRQDLARFKERRAKFLLYQ